MQTVDSEEIEIKFPEVPGIKDTDTELNRAFCIWYRDVPNLPYDKNSAEAAAEIKKYKCSDFCKNLSIINVFNTVEGFWQQYLSLNLKKEGSFDISFFEHSIRPIWEDPALVNGTTIEINYNNFTFASKNFETLLLNFIGNGFFKCQNMAGITFKVRLNTGFIIVLQIWLKSSDQEFLSDFSSAIKRLTNFQHKMRFIQHKSKL